MCAWLGKSANFGTNALIIICHMVWSMTHFRNYQLLKDSSLWEWCVGDEASDRREQRRWKLTDAWDSSDLPKAAMIRDWTGGCEEEIYSQLDTRWEGVREVRKNGWSVLRHQQGRSERGEVKHPTELMHQCQDIREEGVKEVRESDMTREVGVHMAASVESFEPLPALSAEGCLIP
jgi:hypothetical protein